MSYFWFPMQHLRASTWLRGMRLAGAILLAGSMVAALMGLRRRGLPAPEAWLVIGGLTVLAGYVRLNLTWWDPEARFLLPAFATLVYGFVVGMAGSTEDRPVSAARTTGLLGLAAFSYLFFALA